MAGKWGIDLDSQNGWEEEQLARSRTNPMQVSDNGARSESVLVDVKGQPLIVKEPRSVGFRKPGERP